MPESISANQHYLPGEAGDSPLESPTGGAKSSPLLRVLHSAKRHWLLVLVIWIFTAGPASVAVWKFVEPAYAASADVEVTPVMTPILGDQESDPIGIFDTYLNTQGQIVTSSSVLRAALANPDLQGLPLLATVDPVASLRVATTVKPLPRTNLFRVSVQQPTAGEAIKLARAVMKAYSDYAGGYETRKREETQRILRELRERLNADLKRQRDEIAKLATQYNATSEEMFRALRENKLRLSEQTAGELERARIRKAQLETELNQLNKDLLPTSMPADDYVWRQQWIESDLAMQKLRADIAQEALFLLRHSDNVRHQETKTDLEKQLAEREKAVSAEADERVKKRRQAMLDDAKRKIQEQLAGASELVQTLQTNYDTLKNDVQDMGKVSLDIQRLQAVADSAQKELDRVEERLRQLEIANRQQARISVSLEPEVLPDGVQNKRARLATVAIVGGLLLGLALAFVKDLVSGRLYSMDDVEGGVGLHLLGALPALEDLRRGLITEQDFRESYRAIQATLAGAAPDGQVPRTLLITSAQAAEGKTSLAVSLAASLAESGNRVLVIDGDTQAPRIGKTLKLSLPFGLRQVLLGERTLTEAVGPTPIRSLDVLLCDRNGRPVSGVLTSRLAADVLKAAADHYDHVVIDSPPVLGSADALIWAQVVDGVIFSSFAGYSSMKVVRQACARTANVGGRIYGAVICNVSVRENYYSYSYAASRQSGQETAGRKSSGRGYRALPLVHLSTQATDTNEPAAGD